MYKDKAKQRQANREAQARFKAKKADSEILAQNRALQNARGCSVLDNLSNTRPVIPQKVIPGSNTLPDLPKDEILACNQHVTWSDVLKLSRDTIDTVYNTHKAIGDDILLRLKRAAGYGMRTGRL